MWLLAQRVAWRMSEGPDLHRLLEVGYQNSTHSFLLIEDSSMHPKTFYLQLIPYLHICTLLEALPRTLPQDSLQHSFATILASRNTEGEVGCKP